MLGRGEVLKSLHLHFFMFLPLKGIEDVSYPTNPRQPHLKTDTGFPERKTILKLHHKGGFFFFLILSSIRISSEM